MEVIMETLFKPISPKVDGGTNGFSIIGMLLIFIVLAFLFTSCAALTNLIGQPQLKTYTFTYNGQEYPAILPKEVPELPEFAKMTIQCYDWIGPLCVNHVRYVENQVYPVVSFWFTADLGVVALIYHADVEGKLEHIPYIYLKGLPVKVTVEEVEKLLEKWSKPPKK